MEMKVAFFVFVLFAVAIARNPEICGGIAGLTCDDGKVCDYGIGNCQVADASGVCVPKPDVCT
eukprot:CAMPEP_0177650066 /NCGR_PEP_ID=MMETSP0447-20121125/11731_1 /TAXON_ID=0 /ORGANISM="Stygamoeba regulata, Strain BSH-02190019" /LENGTH=62 /DNA_ID=CAMNT_0019152885 /DNA_START=55 /DNA_END=240 /DNA_ORIENTATION=-